MSTIPSVSVLMPVYNAERYVAEAVESILAQTFGDFEFIIIDDGSTDGSHAILEHYTNRDSRIRLVSRPNTGYVVALNEMLRMARGEFVARMDADDVALADRFARQVEYLLEHDECVALGCQVLLVDSDGDPIRKLEHKLEHTHIVRFFLEQPGGGMTHPCAMIRRNAVVTIGGYREEFETAEDMDLFLRLAGIGQLANLPDVLLEYRMHTESVGGRLRKQQLETVLALVKLHGSKFGFSGSPQLASYRPPTQAWEQHCKWAWWALGAKNVGTARKHALRALRLAPFSWPSWRVLACAIRGY